MEELDKIFEAFIAFLIVVMLIIPVFAYFNDILTGQACQPYIQQIQTKRSSN